MIHRRITTCKRCRIQLPGAKNRCPYCRGKDMHTVERPKEWFAPQGEELDLGTASKIGGY